MAKKKVKVPWGELGAAAGFGAAVGGVLGLLLSPHSGEQNRKLVVKKARRVSKVVASSATKAVHKAETSVAKATKPRAKK